MGTRWARSVATTDPSTPSSSSGMAEGSSREERRGSSGSCGSPMSTSKRIIPNSTDHPKKHTQTSTCPVSYVPIHYCTHSPLPYMPPPSPYNLINLWRTASPTTPARTPAPAIAPTRASSANVPPRPTKKTVPLPSPRHLPLHRQHRQAPLPGKTSGSL